MLRLFKKDKAKYSNEELLEMYRQQQDNELLAELYTRYTHMVYGVCMKYLKDPDDASDAVMNIYEKLVADINRHQIIRFATWLYVLTKNHCLMHIRTQKSIERKHNLWQQEQEYFMESIEILHPIDDLENHNRQLQLCIEELKAEQKACICLFYYENKCYHDIAIKLQIDEKKVKSHLQNGKRNLRICLDRNNEKE